LSFAKTPQGFDSSSRNNVTGHSYAYSFQPRFETLKRKRQEGGRYVIDFKYGQNFGEPQVIGCVSYIDNITGRESGLTSLYGASHERTCLIGS